MQISYKNFVNTYDPVSVGWNYQGKDLLLEFPEPITAIYSEKIDRVVVELFSNKQLNFYKLSGELDFSASLPGMDNYQYRGLNKSIESQTGISFLFHPITEKVGNEWRDTEQYELNFNPQHLLGKRLGIYR